MKFSCIDGDDNREKLVFSDGVGPSVRQRPRDRGISAYPPKNFFTKERDVFAFIFSHRQIENFYARSID